VLDKKTGILVPTPKAQYSLFHVEKQAEINGIEMGVLENGVPYLTERGLARMCGVDGKVLNRMAASWSDEKLKPRGKQISALLEQSGYTEDTLFLKSEHRGQEINAYTEPVCLALLEYYAFLADEKRQEAVNAFRALARMTFRGFIYAAVGYAPSRKYVDSWTHFHDRLDITKDAAPKGYFIVFQEIASMIIPMINADIMISDKVVPDISVGMSWAGHWDKGKLEEKYGPSIRCEHEYPDYYPQAKSNPQTPRAYPNASLGEFREWLQDNYIANQFPRYLIRQVKMGKLSRGTVEKAIETFAPKAIKP